MAEGNLSQGEADALIQIEKRWRDDLVYTYPGVGGLLTVPLISIDCREEFILDVRRGRIDLSKVTHQLRGRVVAILVRVDIAGPPHTNPDGVVVPCPHIHLYKENFGDKWAQPLPPSYFSNVTDLWQVLHDFMDFCRVVEKPQIERGLFS